MALYGEGLSIAEVSRKLGICTRTAVVHLVRRSAQLRPRGLAAADTPEAVRLQESGPALMEVGLTFGVSQQAVRKAVTAAGVEIRPRGRRPQLGSLAACPSLQFGSHARWRGRARGIHLDAPTSSPRDATPDQRICVLFA